MAKAISFKNWTTEDFTWMWNSAEYDFPAGATTLLEEALAHHFAKHLTDRELLKMKDDKGEQLQVNHFSREKMYKKCFPAVAPIEARNETELQIKMDNPLPTETVSKKSKKIEEEINPAFKE